MFIDLSDSERAGQRLSDEHQQLSTQLLEINGCVVIRRAIPAETVDQLLRAFLPLLQAEASQSSANRGANRYQMHLPFQEPFTSPQVITNSYALPLVHRLLGSDAVCHYFASDTPLPGSEYQRVHSDVALLFPEMPLSLPAYSMVLNIPLVDFTEENGPLEIWPGGSHLMPGGVDILAMAERMPSQRVLMPAGSVLLRDMRMWHRGTPNLSTSPRPNLALIYSRPWLKTHYRPIPIRRDRYNALSDVAKHLFRFEDIGR